MRIAVDASRPLADEPGSGHNRWHPAIEPIARIAQGEELTLETRDGIDGQLGPGAAHEEAGRLDLGLGHPLTGPIWVEGASPGDVLEVEILALEHAAHGVTCIAPGFGFLHDVFAEPYVVSWDLRDGFARSPLLPGVAVPADMFPGVIGVAPSQQRLAAWRAREAELKARGGAVADDVPERAVPASAAAGARTIPPRELGGNLDVRGLVAGSRLYLPVDVPGALFSVGDLHFAQGDGESCGVAIETAGAITVRFRVHSSPRWRPGFPAYETPPRPARREFAVTGSSLSADGRNESLDLALATRNALLAMIDWLEAEKGLDRRAAYVLCSACVDLRLSEVVDVPNPIVSAAIPLDVFADPTPERIVRARRRTEALGRAETERRREEAIAGRLEHAIRDAAAWRVDADAERRLDEATRAELRELGFLVAEPAPDAGARLQGRVEELQRELGEARARQQALHRFVEALDAEAPADRIDPRDPPGASA